MNTIDVSTFTAQTTYTIQTTAANNNSKYKDLFTLYEYTTI